MDFFKLAKEVGYHFGGYTVKEYNEYIKEHGLDLLSGGYKKHDSP